MPHISIVSPVYGAEKIIPELVRRIVLAVTKITDDYEIILVEDCGTDNSWQAIEKEACNNPKIKGYKLSRNFGQHYAITAGLDQANGDWVVVMDCDLQDRPEEILNLYSKAQEGYEVVLAKRIERQDHFLKRLFSKLFYRTLGYLTGSKIDESIANFGIYKRNVVDAIISLRESIRFFPTMVRWVGFSSTSIPVQHAEREEGSSSYNFKRLINLGLDIILAYSDKPIRLLIKSGIVISILSFVFAVIFFIEWMGGSIKVLGYTSLIISIWFFSGLILMTLGLVGLYVGKIFEGVKNRPIYIINKKIND